MTDNSKITILKSPQVQCRKYKVFALITGLLKENIGIYRFFCFLFLNINHLNVIRHFPLLTGQYGMTSQTQCNKVGMLAIVFISASFPDF